jgi:acylphosphatase
MNKIKATVSGRIQKVGYRAKVIGIAKELGLTGFIQNLDDGRVKIIAESKNGDFGKFLDAIRIKNTLIDVFDVEVEYADATGNFADAAGDFSDFYKLVGGGETDERLDAAAGYLKEMIGIMRDGFSDMRTGFSEGKEEMRTGFGNLDSKMDATLASQNETTAEIRGLREDLKTYTDRKFGELESELDVIKVALKSNGILC